MADVVLEPSGGMNKIRLNRPQKANALTDESTELILKYLQESIDDPAVKVVIFCGAGDNFTGGLDLSAGEDHIRMVTSGQMSGWDLVEKFQGRYQKFTQLLRSDQIVTIAAVKGWTLGGGFEISIACDMVVAAENTRFGFPEVKAGNICTGASTKLLPQIVGSNRAREWMFLGEPIPVEEAYRAGLVNRVVPVGEEEQEAEKIAQQLLTNLWEMTVSHKRLLNACPDMDVNACLEFEKAQMTLAAQSNTTKQS